ncbi:CHAP domain-containing protein [Parafilimonas terrae]|uniref:CHAP domain-containing protein n=2 Tax=Parafilimonas terrae TaxID=1465490 RepID=A0A1I5WEU6_9BACT|nr:CHAP domain-containing protein [Parafilimonas terrae]
MSRQNLLEVAAYENGTTETNSNLTKYGEWYGLNGVKWCAIFVSWVFHHAGYPLGQIDKPKGFHYCPSGYMHWKEKGCFTDDPQPGDIILYDFHKQSGQIADHTGIFVRWIKRGSSFEAWEGNTSKHGDTDGGHVMLQDRYINSVRAFVNPEVYGYNF